MQTTTSLTFFTAIFVTLGGALAEELMICCRHVRTELYDICDPGYQNQSEVANRDCQLRPEPYIPSITRYQF